VRRRASPGSTSSLEVVRKATPVNFADVDHDVAAAGDVAVHDVEAGAVVELGVLEALAGSRALRCAVEASSRILVSVRMTCSSS
jgi:hypothetical protein